MGNYCCINSEGSSKTSTLSLLQTEKVGKNHFHLMKLIGQGLTGDVFLVEKIDSKVKYAMKIVSKRTAQIEKINVITEKQILAGMNSPFVVKLHYAFQTSSLLYFVMDYMSGGDLGSLIEKTQLLSPRDARFYLAEILLALEHLHNNNIFYRDLKPQNILIDKTGHVKLADFGISRIDFKSNDIAHTMCGSVEYMAPEILKGRGYSFAADFWSYGALVHELLSGSPPHNSTNSYNLMNKIMHEPVTLERFTHPERSFLSLLLEIEPEKRCSSFEVLKSMSFFADINWSDIECLKIFPPYIPEETGMYGTAHFNEPDSSLGTVSNFSYYENDGVIN